MANYHILEIEKASTRAAASVARAKKDGEYDGNEARWDAEVVSIVQPLARQAAQWTAQNAALIKTNRRAAQSAVKNIEGLLKDKKFGDKHMRAIQQQAQIVLEKLAEVQEDNGHLTEALAPQYRHDSWITTARDAMQDPGPINDLQKARQLQIKVGAVTIEQAKRMEEYETRVNAYIKAGQRKLNDLNSLNDAVDDVNDIVGEMEASRQAVSDIIYRASNSLNMIDQNKKTKTALDPKVLSMIQSYIPKFKGEGKKARGKLKTMTIQINMLTKRLKGTVGLASMCKPQIKQANEHLNAAKAEYKDFEEQVKNAEKIVKKLEKLG
jgi:archaellum component FlaC